MHSFEATCTAVSYTLKIDKIILFGLYLCVACSSFKAVIEAGWKNYGLQQPRNSLPIGPLVIMIHMASVWVPSGAARL